MSLTKWIIDTNVIAHWLMADKIMNFASQKFLLSQEFVTIYNNRNIDSILFVNKALKSSKSRHLFLITELSLNELFSAIRDEVRCIILFKNGVPISRWANKRETKEVSFPLRLSKEIYELAMKGYDDLFAKNKLEILAVTSPSDAQNYLEVYSSLVFRNPELTTQDAIIITNAIFEKVDRFVTADKGLQRMHKELLDNYNIEILSPKKASTMIPD